MKHGDIHAHMERMYQIHSWWEPLLKVIALLRYVLFFTALAMALDLPKARHAFWTVLIMQGLSLGLWVLGKVAIERELTRFQRRMRGRA